jgi:uncharacterized membrane protein SpoIIM required for sporulation
LIIDLQKFIEQERSHWELLEKMLHSRRQGKVNFSLPELRKFNYLYERAAGDLVKISTFSGEKELSLYLENLTAACYAEIHAKQTKRLVFNPGRWLFRTFPATFRKNINSFLLSLTLTLAGVLFGGISVIVDNSAKETIIPGQFGHVMQSPDERVKKEESGDAQHKIDAGDQATFATYLMVNNIKVSILAMSLGITFGIGTTILLFYNGVILGAIAVDFIRCGQTAFLAGWLLPHGAFEIPAIIIAGQAGLIIGGCLLRLGKNREGLFSEKRKDIINLICGVAVMLVWAGIVEAFFSQYHEPVISYSFKITFGCAELFILILWLGLCGLKKRKANV